MSNVSRSLCLRPNQRYELHPVVQQHYLSKGVGGQDLATHAAACEARPGSCLTKTDSRSLEQLESWWSRMCAERHDPQPEQAGMLQRQGARDKVISLHWGLYQSSKSSQRQFGKENLQCRACCNLVSAVVCS